MKFTVRIAKVLDAWSTLRPTKSFAGMTVEQFTVALKASQEARDAAAIAETTYAAAIAKRDNAEAEVRRIVVRVVAGVVADPDEGDNGEVYKAMGYIRRDDRNSGLTRRAQEKEVSQPLAA